MKEFTFIVNIMLWGGARSMQPSHRIEPQSPGHIPYPAATRVDLRAY